MAVLSKLAWYKCLAHTSDLTHAEFRVLVIIAGYTDGNLDNAYPSLATIVSAACVSEPTAKKAIKTLRGKGWLVLVEQGGNQHGKGRANVYSVRTPERAKGVAGAPPSPVSKGASGFPPLGPGKGAIGFREGDTSVSPEGGKPAGPHQIPLSEPREQGAPVASGEATSAAQRSVLAVVPPTTCGRHQGAGGNTPPCRDCAASRKIHREWLAEQRRDQAANATQDARRRAAARIAAAAACDLCDEHGTRLNGMPCDHDADRERRNAAGSARVRAALRKE